jgi:hypothetical protein
MTRRYYAVAAPVAVFLSVAPIADPVIWMWFLLATEAAVCLALIEEWQSGTNPVSVASDNVPLRIAPRRRWASS